MSGSLFKQVLRNIKKNVIGLVREGGIEDVARVKFESNQGEAWSLYSGNVPSSGIYLPVFSAATEGGKLIVIQAGSPVVDGHESELEG